MSHKYSSLPTGNTIPTITISIISTITINITVTIIYIGEYDEYNTHRGSNYNSNNGNYIEVSTNYTI